MSSSRKNTPGTGQMICRRERLVFTIYNVGYDAERFCESLEISVRLHKMRRGQPDKKIRFCQYAAWANRLKKKQVLVPEENCGFGFPEIVLEYLREILPRNVVGEIRPDAYKIDLETFCKAVMQR